MPSGNAATVSWQSPGADPYVWATNLSGTTWIIPDAHLYLPIADLTAATQPIMTMRLFQHQQGSQGITVEAFDMLTSQWVAVTPYASVYPYNSTNMLSSGVSGWGGSINYQSPGKYQFIALDLSSYIGSTVQLRITNRNWDTAWGSYITNIRIDEEASDADGDGIVGILAEWLTYGTDPTIADTDGDGINDGAEVAAGTNPLNAVSFNQPPVAGINLAKGAVQFDGVNDYVYAGNGTGLVTGTGVFTQEAWIKTAAVLPRMEVLNIGNEATIGQGTHLYVNSVGKLAFDLSNIVAASSTKTINDGQWHYVAAVFNGAQVQLYIDGIADGLAVAISPNILLGNVMMGMYIDNLGAQIGHFSGTMDELRVWNTARSQGAIQVDMYAELIGNEPNLIGYWSFNDFYSAVANDATVNANHGVFGGGVASASPTRIASMAFGLSNPVNIGIPMDNYATLWLAATDAESNPTTLAITALPSIGTLWQTVDGINPYTQITAVNTVVMDSYGRVVFVPLAGQSGIPYSTFDIVASDTYSTSSPLVVTIDVLLQSQIIAAVNGNNSISGANCNTVWDAYGFPYHVQSNVTIASGCRLQIDAYAVVKLAPAVQIRVQAGGIFDVYGTASNPVYFTSIKDDTVGGDINNDGIATLPAAGDWQNIYYEANAGGTMQYAEVRYAGSNATRGGIYLAASIGLNGVTVMNSASHSLVIDGRAASTITNSVFDGSTKEGIYLTSTSNAIMMDASNTISNTNVAYLSEQGMPVGITATVAASVTSVVTTGRLQVGVTLASLNLAQFTAWETQIGRPLRRVQRMYNLDEPAYLWNTEVPNMLNAGFKLMLTLEPKLNTDIYATSPSRLNDITAGLYDAAIDASINGIINNVQPSFPDADIWIRIAQEMNGDWYPWGGLLDAYGNPHNGNTAANYIAAYQHIVQRYRAAGLGENMVKFIWSPNVWPTDNFTMFYPGDPYTDYIGVAGFNFGPNTVLHPNLVWQTFNTIHNYTYNTLVAAYPSKQIIIAGISSAESGGSKATWVTDMATQLKNGYPSIVGVFWFNLDKTSIGETDWRIDSSPTSLTAVQQMYLDNLLWR